MKKIKLLLQWYWIKRTNEFRATYDSDQAWARIQKRIHQRQRIKVFYRYGAAACIFGLVALSAGFFYTYRHHTSEIAEILARTPSNKAVLHLENGRIYNLENTPPPLLLDYEGMLNSQKNDATKNSSDKLSAYATLEVPRGGEYTLQLSDSSKVHLNAASRLKYPIVFAKGAKREIFLEEGEAYLEVSSDKQHPFIIHTPLTDIEVIGTKFNVTLYDSLQTQVTLMEGLVKLHGSTFHTHLHPGETAFINKDSVSLSSANYTSTVLWTQGIYEYYNTELQQITRQLSLWYDVDFIFADRELATCKFAGVIMKKYSLQEALDMLSKVSKVKFRVHENNIEITK